MKKAARHSEVRRSRTEESPNRKPGDSNQSPVPLPSGIGEVLNYCHPERRRSRVRDLYLMRTQILILVTGSIDPSIGKANFRDDTWEKLWSPRQLCIRVTV